MAPAPAQIPVDRRDDRLRAGPHGLDEVARHFGEPQQVGRLHRHQRPDDVEHVAPRREVPTRSGQDEGLDGLVRLGGSKQADEFRIGFEGQRILPFGPVQRDRADEAVDGQRDVLRGVGGERRHDGAELQGRHDGDSSDTPRRTEDFSLASNPIRASMSLALRSSNIAPIQSPCCRAIAWNAARPSGVMRMI